MTLCKPGVSAKLVHACSLLEEYWPHHNNVEIFYCSSNLKFKYINLAKHLSKPTQLFVYLNCVYQ